MPETLRVEVVLAYAERQELVAIDVADGCTVGEAIDLALSAIFPDVHLDALQCGIWGQPVERSRRLREGDRVELYRPLETEPRDARRNRAAGKD